MNIFSRFIKRAGLGLLLSMILLNTASIAQTKKQDLDMRRNDVFKELSESKLTLRFFDALNGQPIQGGKVVIKGVGEYETEYNGTIAFDIPEDNIYTIYFTHPKYIESAGDFEVMAGTIFFNRFSVSPLMNINNFRIILEWDDRPADLDANLLKVDGYHISYRKKKVSSDGEARLDRDDRDGEGPETITVLKTNHYDRYVYYVDDFSNRSNSSSKSLAKSKAVVRVYGEGRLMKTIKIDRNGGRGNKWIVFEIVNGEINIVNAIN